MAGKRGREELTEADVQGMKVADLKDELKARGLDSTGKKAELSDRLTASLGSAAAENSGTASPEKAASPKSSPKLSPTKASPKSSPKVSPKKAPKAPSPKKGATSTPAPRLHKGKLYAPEFGAEDYEAAGRYMMCVGPILGSL